MKSKRVVIVGGTSGIGRALAESFVEDNDVLIVGRNAERGRAFVERKPQNARFIQSDVSLLGNVVRLVRDIKQEFGAIDFIVHTADVLRTKRVSTEEGLELSVATNYFSRVLFNQLIVAEEPTRLPHGILHVALAGFRPPRGIATSIPLSDEISSFKGHRIGQAANDFYGIYLRDALRRLGTRITILNAGLVDTEIRRQGQFPFPVRGLIWLMEFIMGGRMRSPTDYARMLTQVMDDGNDDADHFTLLDSRGRGITGGAVANTRETQEALYRATTGEIDRVLGGKPSIAWLALD